MVKPHPYSDRWPMLAHTLHGHSCIAILLPVGAPLDQFFLRGAFRQDGTTLWFEWNAGGFPLPFDLSRLDREIVSLTSEIRSSLLGNTDNRRFAAALAETEYFCGVWVATIPADAISVPGCVAVASPPDVRHAVDVARWLQS